MTYATIDDLRSQLGKAPSVATTPEYAAKMLHPIPQAPVVDRAQFILKRCEGKRVLEFGASGPLHEAIRKVAADYWGVDREHGPGGWQQSHIVGFDLDDVAKTGLPYGHYEAPDDQPGSQLVTLLPDIIICGEVLEHLTNPGWFLTRLRKQYDGVPVMVTVPNAFSRTAQVRMKDGIENVNRDHVAWYSYTTLTGLLAKCGYQVLDWAWYHGDPLTAEGLVVVCV